MFWNDVQEKPDSVFKRLTGVRRATFEGMVEVVRRHIARRRKHPTRGRPPKVATEDQVLMLLMYYREYRTFSAHRHLLRLQRVPGLAHCTPPGRYPH